MAKILSKSGEQQLVMVNYACGFNLSETGKYFEWIIIKITQIYERYDCVNKMQIEQHWVHWVIAQTVPYSEQKN